MPARSRSESWSGAAEIAEATIRTRSGAVNDRRYLYAAAFLRALATGMIGVLIGIDLARRGFDSAEIGLVVGVGLAGAALAALFVTLLGDRFGRRRALVAVAILGGVGGLGVALGSEFGVVG